jgi:mannosidase alpha-like ER degradation enhancer 2
MFSFEGIPYGTVNLVWGVPIGETNVTCTAGGGTFLIEFGTLSRLTGDPIYERVALRALQSLWEKRSSINLVKRKEFNKIKRIYNIFR